MWNYKYKGQKEHSFNFTARDIIYKQCPDIKSSIEIGAGTGQMSKLLKDKCNIDVTMVDNSQSACHYMRDYFWDCGYEFDIKMADIFLLKVERQYELSMSSGLIEHFQGDILEDIINIHKQFSKKYVCFIVPHACEYEIEFAKSAECKKQYGFQKPFTTQELDRIVVDDSWEKVHSEVFYNDRLLIGVYKKNE